MTISQFLTVAFFAMAPISELRGALPLAYWGFHWPIAASFLVSVVFNIIAGWAIFLLLEPMSRLLRAYWPAFNNFYLRLRAATERRHGPRLKRYGAFGVGLLAAVPLPLAGAWTAALLAHILKLPPRFALPAISLGTLVAGFLVSAAVLLGDQVPALLKMLLLGKMQP